MQYFSEKLRILRKRRGITTRELALILGIKKYGYIPRIEVGKIEPSAEFINQVANLFDIPVEKLVNDEFELD